MGERHEADAGVDPWASTVARRTRSRPNGSIPDDGIDLPIAQTPSAVPDASQKSRQSAVRRVGCGRRSESGSSRAPDPRSA